MPLIYSFPGEKNQKSFNNIICFFLCLFLSAIIILFSTIPICLHNNLSGKIILIAYLVLLFSFFIVYALLLCLNPDIVPSNNKRILNGLIEKNTNLKKYCYKCFIPKKILLYIMSYVINAWRALIIIVIGLINVSQKKITVYLKYF